MSGKTRLLVLVLPLTLTACEWFTDFKRQPSVGTWEILKDSLTPSRGNPQMSVPITGTAVAGFQVSYGAFPATIDSMSAIPNPTPVSDSSLANGRKYFQINCSPCHGIRAMGDGPATQFGMPGINLTQDITKARTDGYIFGMIRNGRGLMPSYNRIEEKDRWDVVNYVRALQGVNGRKVEVGPLAAPGVNGDKVPRSTRTGPNVPAPFYNPRELLNPAGQTSVSPAAATQQGLPPIGVPGADTVGGKTAAVDSVTRARAAAIKARADSLRGKIR
ncbi:MAG TPA: cytochrome c [Gemmatimonadaceae bacterium]|nr:cytochrome c [Gemmatimonadaceae bacterium]